MIFPSVGDHGVHMLASDLQHGGHIRGDASPQPVHPDCETLASGVEDGCRRQESRVAWTSGTHLSSHQNSDQCRFLGLSAVI
jgi:hypothetical protein